jgi:hypothetical protein
MYIASCSTSWLIMCTIQLCRVIPKFFFILRHCLRTQRANPRPMGTQLCEKLSVRCNWGLIEMAGMGGQKPHYKIKQDGKNYSCIKFKFHIYQYNIQVQRKEKQTYNYVLPDRIKSRRARLGLPRARWCHDDNEWDEDVGKGPGSGDVRRQEGGGGVKNGARGRIGPGRPGCKKKWDPMDRCED